VCLALGILGIVFALEFPKLTIVIPVRIVLTAEQKPCAVVRLFAFGESLIV